MVSSPHGQHVIMFRPHYSHWTTETLALRHSRAKYIAFLSMPELPCTSLITPTVSMTIITFSILILACPVHVVMTAGQFP